MMLHSQEAPLAKGCLFPACLAHWSFLLSSQADTFQQISKLEVLSWTWSCGMGLVLLCEPSWAQIHAFSTVGCVGWNCSSNLD